MQKDLSEVCTHCAKRPVYEGLASECETAEQTARDLGCVVRSEAILSCTGLVTDPTSDEGMCRAVITGPLLSPPPEMAAEASDASADRNRRFSALLFSLKIAFKRTENRVSDMVSYYPRRAPKR